MPTEVGGQTAFDKQRKIIIFIRGFEVLELFESATVEVPTTRLVALPSPMGRRLNYLITFRLKEQEKTLRQRDLGTTNPQLNQYL